MRRTYVRLVELHNALAESGVDLEQAEQKISEAASLAERLSRLLAQAHEGTPFHIPNGTAFITMNDEYAYFVVVTVDLSGPTEDINRRFYRVSVSTKG